MNLYLLENTLPFFCSLHHDMERGLIYLNVPMICSKYSVYLHKVRHPLDTFQQGSSDLYAINEVDCVRTWLNVEIWLKA